MVGVHPSHQCRHPSQQPSVQLNLGLTLKGGGSRELGGWGGGGLWVQAFGSMSLKVQSLACVCLFRPSHMCACKRRFPVRVSTGFRWESDKQLDKLQHKHSEVGHVRVCV